MSEHLDEPEPFRFEPLPRRAGPLVVSIVFLLVGGAMSGIGIGLSTIDANGDAPVTYTAGSSAGAAAIVGVVFSIFGLLRWTFAIAPFPAELNDWFSFGVLAFGVAAGLTAAARRLDVNGWYLGAAGIAAVAGLLCLCLGLLVRSRRIARRERAIALMASGVARPGIVLDSGLDRFAFDEASTEITTVTFSFTAVDGTRYQVSRYVPIPQRAPIAAGQRTLVWHDPDHPDDARRVVIAIEHALRWNVALRR